MRLQIKKPAQLVQKRASMARLFSGICLRARKLNIKSARGAGVGFCPLLQRCVNRLTYNPLRL